MAFLLSTRGSSLLDSHSLWCCCCCCCCWCGLLLLLQLLLSLSASSVASRRCRSSSRLHQGPPSSTAAATSTQLIRPRPMYDRAVYHVARDGRTGWYGARSIRAEPLRSTRDIFIGAMPSYSVWPCQVHFHAGPQGEQWQGSV